MATISDFIRIAEELKTLEPAFNQPPSYQLTTGTLPPGCPLAVSLKQAAKLLDVSYDTLYKLSKRRGFPKVMIGSKAIVPTAALAEWLKDNIGATVAIESSEEM